MTFSSFRFDRFELDPENRQLRRDGEPIELSARYFDALTLLVREQGRLVSKDRFLDEVWRGVPVTDEALTQCIRTLRKQLGDDAVSPRFIETVPKHGYRFIAPVESAGNGRGSSKATAARSALEGDSRRRFILLGSAGTIGGGVAGILGGLFYGFAAASQPPAPGTGAVSVLLVLLLVTIVIAVLGGAGVSFGIAAAELARGRRGPWRIAGGAVGGLLVGAFVKLLGLDALNLLFGRSPGDITGAAEGALLGASVGLGSWIGMQGPGRLSLRVGVAAGGVAGGAAGLLAALLGGRMLGGSLEQLARSFPDSRLSLDRIGFVFGESGFGPVSQVATGALEGALFGGCVVGAMVLASRRLAGRRT